MMEARQLTPAAGYLSPLSENGLLLLSVRELALRGETGRSAQGYHEPSGTVTNYGQRYLLQPDRPQLPHQPADRPSPLRGASLVAFRFRGSQ